MRRLNSEADFDAVAPGISAALAASGCTSQ
jgi:hypothetical protein